MGNKQPRYFLFTCISFLLILQTAYAEQFQNDTISALDSRVSLEQDAGDPSKLKIYKSQVQHILDSLNDQFLEIKERLNLSSEIELDTLLKFKNELRNDQKYCNEIRKALKKEGDTTGLINQAINLYFNYGTLNARVDDRLRRFENENIRKKAGYIWTAPKYINQEGLYDAVKSSFTKERKVISNLSNSKWGNLLVWLLLSLSFFYWSFKNKVNSQNIIVPITKSLLFFLLFIPLFERNLIGYYLEGIHFLILLLIFRYFRASLSINSSRWWLTLIALYLFIFLFNYMIMSNSFIIRVIIIGLNLCAIYFGSITIKKIKQQDPYSQTLRFLYVFYIFLHLSAVFLNTMGQINLSTLVTKAAMIGFIQLIGFSVFTKLSMQGLNQQILLSKKSKGLLANLNKNRVLSFAERGLTIVYVILWVIVLCMNLRIFESVSGFLGTILNKTHSFGSTTFSLGNILYFLIIVAIANWFQKNIEVLFSTNRNKRFDQQTGQQGTKITLLRLAIIIFGFLLAVTALGISMNKLTVIIGALSVGIGLGMQNIFNNFVSGVILIFEKPFRIGDFVEIADKKGRIQKIGIRSSTLLTQQGSEVIIPNGDLLSGHLVNWTHNTSYCKSELILKVNPAMDIELLKKIITEEAEKNEYLVKEIPLEILYNALSNAALELSIHCWIINIYQEPLFKNNLFERLRTRFKEDEIISLNSK